MKSTSSKVRLFCNVSLVSTVLLITTTSLVKAQPVVWTGDVTLETPFFECSEGGHSGIRVVGQTNLVFSNDLDPTVQPAPKVTIRCGTLSFDEGAELTTISSLDIRISDITSGPVRIINTRGIDGPDAPPTPDIWALRKMQNGSKGDDRGKGRSASGCLIGDHGSSSGATGGQGKPGEDGKKFKAPKGADGSPGNPAGNIALTSRNFAEGTTVYIEAIGGDGGAGGRGGRGADGGDGGKGGRGGDGGNANECHSASRGGNGGRGGDGGDGGNGGPGGNGGRGGNGGNITLALQEGSGHYPIHDLQNNGGLGGDPGLGGERGEGGAGGLGGDPGHGGSGKGGIFGTDLNRKKSGPGGSAGDPGTPGDPGQEGPLGIPGEDGDPGRIGKGFSGTLPQEIIDQLLGAVN